MTPSAVLFPTHSGSVAADVCPTTAAVDAMADVVAPHSVRCCYYCCWQLNDAHSLGIDQWNHHVYDALNYHVVVVVVAAVIRFDVAGQEAVGQRENLAAPTAV